jgi:AcrR family transcriptional regulator
MPRKIPPARFPALIDCATRVFIDFGYRRTQMADIADALGVAKGTLYLYVESKEALFDLALRYADRPESFKEPKALPIPTPKPAATLKYVRERISTAEALPKLDAALQTKRPTGPAAEIESIIRELYGALSRNRRGIKLLDTSSRDWPELAALWFRGGREGLMASLETYLESRLRGRQFRPVPNIPAAARLIIETTVFWAVHRHWDPHPQAIEDTTAQDTVVCFIVGALTKE